MQIDNDSDRNFVHASCSKEQYTTVKETVAITKIYHPIMLYFQYKKKDNHALNT